MADITHNDSVVTESKLKEFYDDIKPFLGCPAYITQEGDSEYYSTDEKVIGRWTDGKPLYQKTIKNTSLTVIAKSTWTTYANVSSLHIDSLVGTSFGRLTSGGNKEDDMSDVCFWTDGTNLQANSRGEGTNTPNGSVVTIKYTKTTDSAVTTVDQDPNKYSTEEKIIGEWIDGKPIYQKTWNGSFALSTNAVVINSIQVPNAGTMVGAELVSDDGIVGDRYAFAFKECGWNSERKLRVSISSGSYTMTSITLRYTKDSD